MRCAWCESLWNLLLSPSALLAFLVLQLCLVILCCQWLVLLSYGVWMYRRLYIHRRVVNTCLLQ